ncbi:MAG: Eco57I restriction-modification methylase domain-containing protein [bacterium]
MSIERYSHVVSRKIEGAHYTPEIFSDFISENIIQRATLKKSVKIVDPAVGDGELLVSLIKKLYQYGITEIAAYGYDTNPTSLEITRNRLNKFFPELSPELYNKDFLEICMECGGISESRDLFHLNETPEFDLLIANPPYIRTQVMGAKTAQLLSKNFGLRGRIDIYQAFLVAMKAVLHPSAIAGVIVSNRFLTTKGAGQFREALFNQYDIKGIWDFGDTKVFEAAVLPAVMLLSPCRKKNNYSVPFKSVYEAHRESDDADAPVVENQIEALNYSGLVKTKNMKYKVKQGYLAFDSKASDLWRLQDSESEQWLNEVAKNTWCTFKEVGKIRVGVKTTADNVFIRSDWIEEVGYLPELLKPLTTHHVAGRYKAQEKGLKSILYTHSVVDGKRRAVDITEYPLSLKYLEHHKEQLAGRNYVMQANRNWFEIWVPQNPSLWHENKIVFRDISEKPTFWMDTENTVVNGDCYWMLRDNKDVPEDILWLALAIANSKFIEDFYDIKFQNKLYSNRRRFITQYVEQFPIPDPNSTGASELISLAKKCYAETNVEAKQIAENRIDRLVWSIFKVPHIESITG